LKGYGETRPQQIVGIGKLHGNLGRLRRRVELVSASDKAALVRVLVAGGQGEPKFALRRGLFEALQRCAALKVHGSRRSADYLDGIQFDDCREAALIARLLGDVRPLLDLMATDDSGAW